MKKVLYSLVLSTFLLSSATQATGNASDFDQESWDKKVVSYTKMTGRTFEYVIAGYKIRLHFDDENNISWERLEAPDDSAGLKGSQKLDRQNIHPGIFVMAWTEDDGSQVIDVVDTQRMTLFANFVMPDGQRFQSQTAMVEVN